MKKDQMYIEDSSETNCKIGPQNTRHDRTWLYRARLAQGTSTEATEAKYGLPCVHPTTTMCSHG